MDESRVTRIAATVGEGRNESLTVRELLQAILVGAAHYHSDGSANEKTFGWHINDLVNTLVEADVALKGRWPENKLKALSSLFSSLSHFGLDHNSTAGCSARTVTIVERLCEAY